MTAMELCGTRIRFTLVILATWEAEIRRIIV
jgi:hypothetical protein